MRRMQIIKPLRDRLNACKGSGRWAAIAARAECNYYTVSRIARGELPNPGCALAERLFAAIKATQPRRPAKASS